MEELYKVIEDKIKEAVCSEATNWYDIRKMSK